MGPTIKVLSRKGKDKEDRRIKIIERNQNN
jgi:hypothetical protein